MPNANELPGPLKELPKRQGVTISRSNFSNDVRSLLSKMNIHARQIGKPYSTTTQTSRPKISIIMSALLFGVLFGAVSAFAWSSNLNQQTLQSMQEELATERTNLLALETQLNASQTLSGALANSDRIVALEAQIAKAGEILSELELYYQARRSPGLDRTALFMPPFTDWDQVVEVHLIGVLEQYESRLDGYNTWANARVEEPPTETCLPQNPFRPRPAQPVCFE